MGYALSQSTTEFTQSTGKETALDSLRQVIAKYLGFGLTNSSFYTYGVSRVLKLETLEFHYNHKLLSDPLNMIHVFSNGEQVANGHMAFTFKDKTTRAATYTAHMTHLFSQPLEKEQELFLLQKTEQELLRLPGFTDAYNEFSNEKTDVNSSVQHEKTYPLTANQRSFDDLAMIALKENEPKLTKYFRIQEENQSLIQTILSKDGQFLHRFLYSLSDAHRPKDSFGNLYMVNYYLVKKEDVSALVETAQRIAEMEHQRRKNNQTTAKLDCELAESYAALRHLELKAQNTLL